MKKLKLFILCGLTALALSSCCNCCKKGENQSCPNEQVADEGRGPRHGGHHHGFGGPEERMPMSEECKAKFEKWANFDNLTEAEQKTLLAERKAEIDKREAEMKKQKEEFEAKWAKFDSLTIAEQKELIDMKSFPMMGGHHHGAFRGHKGEGKPCCNKDEKQTCDKNEKVK